MRLASRRPVRSPEPGRAEQSRSGSRGACVDGVDERIDTGEFRAPHVGPNDPLRLHHRPTRTTTASGIVPQRAGAGLRLVGALANRITQLLSIYIAGDAPSYPD